MRKPHSRKQFHSQTTEPASQPMLMRRRRFRYDEAISTEPSWSESPDSDLDAQEFDMDVTGAGSIGGAAPIRPTQLASSHGVSPAHASGIEAPQDEVRISSAARALGEIDAGSQIHQARLAEIRAAIADGSYETFDKLDAAVDRLIEALRRGDR
jgi:negative regulator of flagellin synthesis FlgM